MKLPFFRDFQRLEKPKKVEVWGIGRMQRRSIPVTANNETPSRVWSPGQVRI